MKVVYIGATDAQIKWGSNDDPRGLLTKGAEYELHHTKVYTQHTKYILREYPNLRFNSVCFREAK